MSLLYNEIMKFSKILILILLAFSLIAAPLSLAQETKVDHVAGVFEKLKEKITLFLIFNNEGKADFQKNLTERRLAELEYIMNKNDIDMLEPLTSRYTTYAGNVVNFTLANKVSSKKDPLITMFQNHTKRIAELQSQIPIDSGWWLALQHGINVASSSVERLKTL